MVSFSDVTHGELGELSREGPLAGLLNKRSKIEAEKTQPMLTSTTRDEGQNVGFWISPPGNRNDTSFAQETRNVRIEIAKERKDLCREHGSWAQFGQDRESTPGGKDYT